MAEQSYLFDFNRTDDFFENMNINFNISDMYVITGYDEDTGEYTYEDDTIGDNFSLKIVTYGGDNIEEYLDDTAEYSKLDIDTIGSGNVISQSVGLDWYNRGNGECTVELHDTVTFTIGDNNIPLKAIFLCEGDYVMGYSINMRAFSVTNEVVFDNDIIFWDISRFNQ